MDKSKIDISELDSDLLKLKTKRLMILKSQTYPNYYTYHKGKQYGRDDIIAVLNTRENV